MTRTSLLVLLAGVLLGMLLLAWHRYDPGREPVRDAPSSVAGVAPSVDEPSTEELALDEVPAAAGGELVALDPEQDRSPGGRRPASSEGCWVRVLGPLGEPLVGARVVVIQGIDVRGRAETGATGIAHFPFDPLSLGRKCGVAVRHPGHPVHAVLVPPGSRELELRLPSEEVFSGTVLVEGAVPSEPITLELIGDQPPTFRGYPLPDAVLVALGADRGRPSRTIRFETELDGSFSVLGLHETWRGVIQYPSEYVVLEEDVPAGVANHTLFHQLRFVSPKQGVLVSLSRARVILGRVVRPDTGEPVPSAAISYRWRGGGSGNLHSSADEDGRFELFEPPSGREERILKVSHRSGVGGRFVELEGFPADELVWDLGDVSTLAIGSIDVLVLGSSGAVVSGAVVQALEGDRAVGRKQKTDSVGACRIEHSGRLRVHAAGFESVDVDAPLESAEPLVVRMQGSTTLVVFTRTRTQLGLRKGFLELSVDSQGLGALPPVMVTQLPLGRAGRFQSFCFQKQGRRALLAMLAEADTVVFTNVPAGVPLGLRFLDGDRISGAELRVPALSEGEHREARLEDVAETRVFRLRVVDSEGKAVRRASVTLRGENGSTHWTETSNAGDAELRGFLPGEGRLLISSRGHPALVQNPYHLPRSTARQTFTLGASRSLDVIVRDEHGAQLSVQSIELATEGVWWTPRRPKRDPTTHVLAGVPLGEVAVRVQVGGHRIEQLAPAGLDQLVFEFPPTGSVSVEYEFDPPLPEPRSRYYLSLRALEGTAEVQRHSAQPGRNRTLFVPVIPGRYELIFEQYDPRRFFGHEPLGDPVQVTALPGERVTVEASYP